MFIHLVINILTGSKIGFALLAFGISLCMFFISWGMMFIVLGFQTINPFCPKILLKYFCLFFIWSGIIAIPIISITDITLSIVQKSDENAISMIGAVIGMLLSAYKIYVKNVVSNEIALK
jgi:hypothetical protein